MKSFGKMRVNLMIWWDLWTEMCYTTAIWDISLGEGYVKESIY